MVTAVHERFLHQSQRELRLPCREASNFSPTGRDYISATGGSNTRAQSGPQAEQELRDLDRGWTAQLLPNVGVGFGYVYHRHANMARHGSRERRAAA